MNCRTEQRRSCAPFLLFALLVFALTAATPAMAQQGRVRDGGKFFSADAVTQAEQTLGEMWSKQQRSVVVETFDAAPKEITDRLGGQSNGPAVSEAFQAFSNKQGEAVAADVYVLITRKPSHLGIWSRKVMQQAGLSSQERDQISQSMVAAFKNKEYDRGLAEATQQLRDQFAKPNDPLAQAPADRGAAPAPAPASERGRGGGGGAPAPQQESKAGGGIFSMGCMTWLIIGAVVMVVFSLIRRIFAGRRQQQAYGDPNQPGGPGYGQPGYGQPGYGQGYGGAGGGAFGRGMAGGVLGGLLGGWLGNQTFGQGSQNTGGDASGGAADPNAADPGQASSGDFGDTSGGDFSGGDFGGDSGGGDSSGGDF